MAVVVEVMVVVVVVVVEASLPCQLQLRQSWQTAGRQLADKVQSCGTSDSVLAHLNGAVLCKEANAAAYCCVYQSVTLCASALVVELTAPEQKTFVVSAQAQLVVLNLPVQHECNDA